MIKQYTIRVNHQRKQNQRNKQKEKKGMTDVHFSVSSAGTLRLATEAQFENFCH